MHGKINSSTEKTKKNMKKIFFFKKLKIKKNDLFLKSRKSLDIIFEQTHSSICKQNRFFHVNQLKNY